MFLDSQITPIVATSPFTYIHWGITIISTISVIVLGWLNFIRKGSDKKIENATYLKEQISRLNTDLELLKQSEINSVNLKSFNELATDVAILRERVANETHLLDKLEGKLDKLIDELD
ncbi:MAG TPA: hypothetical protein VII94_05955 [Candidatus Saccharimonadales bacterium]